jgi:hypothetical protein
MGRTDIASKLPLEAGDLFAKHIASARDDAPGGFGQGVAVRDVHR